MKPQNTHSSRNIYLFCLKIQKIYKIKLKKNQKWARGYCPLYLSGQQKGSGMGAEKD